MQVKQTVSLIIGILSLGIVAAQVTPVKLKTYIYENSFPGNIDARTKKDLQDFYTLRDCQPAWLQPGFETRLNSLLATIQTAAGRGLNEKDYLPEFIRALSERKIIPGNARDSLDIEIKLTAIALKVFNDFFYGNTSPRFGYDGLNFTPACFNIPAMLADHIQQNTLAKFEGYPNFFIPEVKALQARIGQIQKIVTDSSYKEEVINSAKLNAGNRQLLKKLFYLGILDSIEERLSEKDLREKIKEAQRQFSLLADGLLRSTLLKELNISMTTRLAQLKLSINYYRWLSCLSQQEPVIVVNIPAAYLKVYHLGKVVIEMRMIVGKPSTPTPTLTSRIKEVILYPYWTVPNSIATKELLPSIKRNAGYIDAGNYQVLNKQGKIMDPYSINWSALSAKNFPYVIRQSTGCDNALGLLKLDFYSPYGVYLHDTPNKSLFMLNKRYFSHGCMRLEEPTKLGHLVLKNNQRAIDTLEQKGCLRNQAPVHVAADVKMPVVVWYNPAGMDSAGRVIYYEDVYGKLQWMKGQ